jgi:hypothetical protein
MASTRCTISPIVRVVGIERIAQVLHDANKDWIERRAVMGVSHCMVHAQRSARLIALRCLVSEGVRGRLPRLAAYSLPTHSEGA